MVGGGWSPWTIRIVHAVASQYQQAHVSKREAGNVGLDLKDLIMLQVSCLAVAIGER